MSDYIYERYSLSGNEEARIWYQNKVATDEVRRICDLTGAPEPRIQWWCEARGWTPDANTQTFPSPCGGWASPDKPDEVLTINLRLAVHGDDTRHWYQVVRNARHELCHLFQSWDPYRWKDDMTASDSGAHCSGMAKRAESKIQFTDDEWRALVPTFARQLRAQRELDAELASLDLPDAFAYMGGAVSVMRREAAEIRRRQSQPAPTPATHGAESHNVRGEVRSAMKLETACRAEFSRFGDANAGE